MRAYSKEAFAGLLHRIDAELVAQPIDGALAFYVTHFGPGACAWLVHRYKAQFRAAGAVDFELPVSKELPPWMRVAIETFKQRPGWGVSVVTHRGLRKFRVRWARWGHNRPAPQSSRRLHA